MSTTESAPERDPKHDIDFYKMTVDDIAKTKERQFQTTYYSALVAGSIIGGTKVVADLHSQPAAICALIVTGLLVNAAATTYFQFSLDNALHKFRTRLRDIGSAIGRPGESAATKRSRDLPLTIYLVAFPWAVTVFAIWYAGTILKPS